MAGLAAFLVLVVAGVIVWQVHGSGEYVAPKPTPDVSRQADPGAASAALSAFVADVRAGRTPGGSGAASVALRNAAAIHVTDVSARFVAQTGTVAADGSWSADVDLGWRYAGFDRRRVEEEVLVRFDPMSGGGLRIAGFGGQSTSGTTGGDLEGSGGGSTGDDERTPVWLSGAVTVRRTPQTLVVVRGGAKEAAGYLRLARTAVRTVRRVVSWPDPRFVLEVPASGSALEAALAATPGSYQDVAAVTATVDGSGRSGVPVHVFVNPDAIGPLDATGAQVVISHEATHDATGAATNEHRPIWLSEGFADYVALRDVRLPLSTTAGQILKDVRRNGPPAHLPGQAEFNAQSSTFGEEYESAWLACRVLAQLAGEQGLVRIYDRAGTGAPINTVLRSVIGMSVGSFTKVWQQRLSDWAA